MRIIVPVLSYLFAWMLIRAAGEVAGTDMQAFSWRGLLHVVLVMAALLIYGFGFHDKVLNR